MYAERPSLSSVTIKLLDYDYEFASLWLIVASRIGFEQSLAKCEVNGSIVDLYIAGLYNTNKQIKCWRLSLDEEPLISIIGADEAIGVQPLHH